MNPQGALLILLNFVFSAYIIIVLTRFVLQLARADFYNPISQFVLKASNPLLKPLRRIIPGYGGLDVASLVLVVVLTVAKVLVLQVVEFGVYPGIWRWLALEAPKALATVVLNYVFWAVVIRSILSWVAPDPYNPLVRVIVQITEPVMAPVRKLVPPMGGFDLSPMFLLLGIILIKTLFELH